MCNKYNVDLEKFLEDVEAMVSEYEHQLKSTKKNQGGFQR
jgi:hypothetical protein